MSNEEVFSNCMADTYSTGGCTAASQLSGGLSRAPPRVSHLVSGAHT